MTISSFCETAKKGSIEIAKNESHSLLAVSSMLAIGLILSAITNLVTPWNVTAAAVIVALSIVTGSYISIITSKDLIIRAEKRSFNENEYLQRIERVVQSVDTISQIAKGKFGKSIITYQDLAMIEKDVERDGEIWVLTSALELERDEGAEGLADIIKINLKDKKIKYIYFIPDNDDVIARNMKKLAVEWQKSCKLTKKAAKEQIRCYVVPNHFAYMTIVIYNAQNATNSKPPTVLVKFPLSDVYKKEDYPYIYRVETDTDKAWRPFLQSLMYFNTASSICQASHPLPIEFVDMAETEAEE